MVPVLRRRAAAAALTAAVLVALAAGVLACSREPAPPRTIVLIVVDTLRRDALGTYGATTPTPHIDALAQAGATHRGLVASFHQTSMSMAALFTGRTPSLESGRGARSIGWNGQTWCGLARFAAPDTGETCIPTSVPTLGEVLGEAGYWTAGVSSNPLLFRPAGFHRGFQQWVELSLPSAGRTADGRVLHRRGGVTATAVNDAVGQILETRAGDRLFLYVHYMDVHDHMLTGVPYAKTVERLDFGIGKLIGMLRAEGLLEDAVVALLADHGETLTEQHWTRTRPGHRGNPSYAEQLDVPFIVSPARRAPAQTPLRSQDVFVWLADLAGATLPAHDPVLRTDEIFLSELNWQTYQNGRFKSHRKRGSDRVHLIDLVADPGERVDVAHRHPRVAAEHAARMDALSARLGAPGAGGRALSPEDEEALRRLGYLE